MRSRLSDDRQGEVLKSLSDPFGREDIGVRQQVRDGFQFRGQRFRRFGILPQAEILQALNRKKLASLSQHTDRVAYLFGKLLIGGSQLARRANALSEASTGRPR